MKIKSIRMPDDLLDAIALVEKEEKIEETTAVRKLIKIGYESYLAELYEAGKLSLADVARRLHITQIEALDLLLQKGIRGNLDTADVMHSLQKFVTSGR